MKILFPEGPRSDMAMSDVEKAKRAKSFRRKAVITDLCLLLGLAFAIISLKFQDFPLAWPMFCAVPFLLLAGIAGLLLTYRRCPFCGRYFRKWDWTMRPFFWRAFKCPDCDFTPDWDQRHLNGNS